MFDNWCSENGITIFEYLLLDNIDLVDENASKIADSCGTEQDWCFDAIKLKANLFVEQLTSDHAVGEIKRRINLELNLRGYANAKSQKFFSIKPWDFSKHKTIYDYGRSYKSALLQTFGNLKAI